MKKEKKNNFKPRNPVIFALLKRTGGSGLHKKSTKAVRVGEKVVLKKSI